MKDDKWIIQLRKGLFELVILSLLNSKPMYGYELSKELENIPNMAIAGGAIYPILKEAIPKGWVDYYWDESVDGPRRKYYEITVDGEKILSSRLEQYKETYNLITLITNTKE